MRPVSQAFLRAVTGSHEMAARARVLTSFQTGVSPSGTQIPVIAGDVQLDWTADVRGTLDLTTDGTGWDPSQGRSTLQPYGSEIYAERGVIVGGSTEWVGLGYFKIQAVEQDIPGGPLRITASDRMQTVIDGQLLQPVQFGASASVQTVFDQLIEDLYPSAVIDFDYAASSDLLGVAQTTDTDRHGFLTQIASSRGKIMYWDYRGHLIVKDTPQPAAPDWAVSAGRGGVLVSAQRTINRDGVYNAVVATADGGDTGSSPVGIAYDANPGSATYYYGTFGRVPQFYTSPLITTQAQAESAATLMLIKSIGLPMQVNFTAVPNPALEPLDLIQVYYGGESPTDHLLIDTLTMPLTATEVMSGTAHNPAGISVGVISP